MDTINLVSRIGEYSVSLNVVVLRRCNTGKIILGKR